MNVGMSNTVTTAIRDSVREMAIGRTKNTEKADRATVEQVVFFHALHSRKNLELGNNCADFRSKCEYYSLPALLYTAVFMNVLRNLYVI